MEEVKGTANWKRKGNFGEVGGLGVLGKGVLRVGSGRANVSGTAGFSGEKKPIGSSRTLFSIIISVACTLPLFLHMMTSSNPQLLARKARKERRKR